MVLVVLHIMNICRLVVDLSAGTVTAAHGQTDGQYMEMWYNVASNGSKVIMGGLDVNNGQSAHQCYNWSMFDYNSTTLDWSKTYKSNNGNGVRGDGVCITNDNNTKNICWIFRRPITATWDYAT